MLAAITIIFLLGYSAIVFEEHIKINKTASALLTGVLCWTVYTFVGQESAGASAVLSHHLSSISEILFAAAI